MSEPALSTPREEPREKIIEAFMGLLAERSFEEIGFGDVATRAGVSLAQCREAFASTFAVIAAYSKQIDGKVLSGGNGDLAEEAPRERLFDVLMRRLETMAPHKNAIRSLLRSARTNPPLALALNGLAVRSQQWMLTAANIDATGGGGALQAQGLALLYGSVLRTWVRDTDPGLARTMAVLDRQLARAERWAGFLEDVSRLLPSACRRSERRARRRPEPEPEIDSEGVAI